MQFICYPKCTTCIKARKYLDIHNINYEYRDIKEANPSYEELKMWYEIANVDIKKFFNTSGQLYKSLNLKDKIKINTLEENLKLLASDGMLVKRPLIIDNNHVIIGFKEDIYQAYFNL